MHSSRTPRPRSSASSEALAMAQPLKTKIDPPKRPPRPRSETDFLPRKPRRGLLRRLYHFSNMVQGDVCGRKSLRALRSMSRRPRRRSFGCVVSACRSNVMLCDRILQRMMIEGVLEYPITIQGLIVGFGSEGAIEKERIMCQAWC